MKHCMLQAPRLWLVAQFATCEQISPQNSNIQFEIHEMKLKTNSLLPEALLSLHVSDSYLLEQWPPCCWPLG